MKALRIFIFVIIMGSVSSALLVGLDNFTSPTILKNEELKIKSFVLNALAIPHDKTDVPAIFNNKVEVFKINQTVFYASADGAIAFEFRGPGLWGPISGLASVNPDLKTIKTINITHQEETPGLGGRIAEEPFLRQFHGKKFFPKLVFDAIVGATGSSRALEKLLNETLQKNAALLKERVK